MSVPKLPIEPRWVAQTLIPYLLYAFRHSLPYSADITSQVENAISFCLVKPDYPTDGDDVVFERILFAIEHRHRGSAAELSLVTDNLEPLAKFLIRRAQLKGPYELLSRSCRPSDAWMDIEEERLMDVRSSSAVEQKDGSSIPSAAKRPMSATSVSIIPSVEDIIDPRLLNAQPGQFTSPKTPHSITFAEDRYFRHQNQLLKESRAIELADNIRHQQLMTATMPTQHIPHSYRMQDRGLLQNQTTAYPPTSHQQVPSNVKNLGQRHALTGTLPSYTNFVQEAMGYGHSQPKPLQQAFVPVANPYTPLQPSQPPIPQQRNVFVYHFYPQERQTDKDPPIHPENTPMLPQNAQSRQGSVTTTPNFTAHQYSFPNSRVPTLTQSSGVIKSQAAQGQAGAQRRATKEFLSLSKREKAERILQLHNAQNPPDAPVNTLSPIHGLPMGGPNLSRSSPAPPVSNSAAKQPTVTATQYLVQPQRHESPSQNINIPAPRYQNQRSPTQWLSGQSAQEFPRLSRYSNIVSEFPPATSSGLPDVHAQQREGVYKGLQSATDPQRK